MPRSDMPTMPSPEYPTLAALSTGAQGLLQLGTIGYDLYCAYIHSLPVPTPTIGVPHVTTRPCMLP